MPCWALRCAEIGARPWRTTGKWHRDGFVIMQRRLGLLRCFAHGPCPMKLCPDGTRAVQCAQGRKRRVHKPIVPIQGVRSTRRDAPRKKGSGRRSRSALWLDQHAQERAQEGATSLPPSRRARGVRNHPSQGERLCSEVKNLTNCSESQTGRQPLHRACGCRGRHGSELAAFRQCVVCAVCVRWFWKVVVICGRVCGPRDVY